MIDVKRYGRGEEVIDLRRYGVLDSGANAHCVSKHLRLMNPRLKQLWMRDAASRSTLLDRAGDFLSSHVWTTTAISLTLC